MSATIRRSAAALRDFLRGFLGLAADGAVIPTSTAAAKAALAERCEKRKSCC